MKKLIILCLLLGIVFLSCKSNIIFTAKLTKVELRRGFGWAWEATFDDGHVISIGTPDGGWIIGKTYQVKESALGFTAKLLSDAKERP